MASTVIRKNIHSAKAGATNMTGSTITKSKKNITNNKARALMSTENLLYLTSSLACLRAIIGVISGNVTIYKAILELEIM